MKTRKATKRQRQGGDRLCYLQSLTIGQSVASFNICFGIVSFGEPAVMTLSQATDALAEIRKRGNHYKLYAVLAECQDI